MTIIIAKKKLAFFSIPKVACSSIKTALFEVENGFPFQPFFANGVYCHIHSAAYPSRSFAFFQNIDLSDYLKLALVRDPVERFLSCYSNRVGYYRELSAQHLGPEVMKTGLTPDPTVHEFVEYLDAYVKASYSISYHVAPMVRYLGTDREFYNRVFKFSEIEQLRQTLSDYVKAEVVFPRLQTGGEKISPDALSAAEVNKIKEFYAEDYDVYGDYFEPSPLPVPELDGQEVADEISPSEGSQRTTV